MRAMSFMPVLATLSLLSGTARANIERPVLPPASLIDGAFLDCLETLVEERADVDVSKLALFAGPLPVYRWDETVPHLADYLFTGRTYWGTQVTYALRVSATDGGRWRRLIDDREDHYFVADEMKMTAHALENRSDRAPVPASLYACAHHFSSATEL